VERDDDWLPPWFEITDAEKAGKLNRFTLPPRDVFRAHFIPDLHWEGVNHDVVEHIMDVCRGVDLICQIGDGMDCYTLSSFDRNPRRRSCLQEEADAYRTGFWAPLCRDNPCARKIQLLGNHEERLLRFLWKRAPELAGMRSMTWRRVWEFDEHGLDVEIHESSGLLIAGHRAKHGERVSAQAGASARLEMEDHRSDGVSGHTHRYGRATRKDKEGRVTNWWEIGHACRTDIIAAEYVKNPNWNLSAGLGMTVYPDGTVEYVEHRLD
jgi:hypothetical protein